MTNDTKLHPLDVLIEVLEKTPDDIDLKHWDSATLEQKNRLWEYVQQAFNEAKKHE
jgi:hypothetical protein